MEHAVPVWESALKVDTQEAAMKGVGLRGSDSGGSGPSRYTCEEEAARDNQRKRKAVEDRRGDGQWG